MLNERQVREAAATLRRLVAAVEAGDLDAEPSHLQRLRGACTALEELVSAPLSPVWQGMQERGVALSRPCRPPSPLDVWTSSTLPTVGAGFCLCGCMRCWNRLREPRREEDGAVLNERQVREAAATLRRLVAAVEAGDLDAEPSHLQRLRGACTALEELVSAPLSPVWQGMQERREGRTVRGIAASLTADGVPTARGGAVWSPSSVQSVLASQQAADLG